MNITDASTNTTLQVAQIVPCTAAEGPGLRFALWLQGCPLRCPGCCNPEMLKFDGGTPTSVLEILEQVTRTQESSSAAGQSIEGITLLGGEPFAHAAGAAELAGKIQEMGLTVMIFSGFTIEQLRANESDNVNKLLSATDILVDGPYIKEQPDTSRRWIGSKNQRIHFLTNRYDQTDSRWDQQDTLEIRLEGSELSVNGFPAGQAVGMWKRPKRS